MAKKSVAHKARGFASENDLGRSFKASVAIKRKMPYGTWHSWEARELQGLFGVPDHLLVLWKPIQRGRRLMRIISFEIKREKWRRALVQAYRYLAFSDYSFVVMDQAYIHRAIAGIEEFKRANVGLLSVSRMGQVFWHNVPIIRKPYSERARRLLKDAILSHLFDSPRKAGGPTIKWTL